MESWGFEEGYHLMKYFKLMTLIFILLEITFGQNWELILDSGEDISNCVIQSQSEDTLYIQASKTIGGETIHTSILIEKINKIGKRTKPNRNIIKSVAVGSLLGFGGSLAAMLTYLFAGDGIITGEFSYYFMGISIFSGSLIAILMDNQTKTVYYDLSTMSKKEKHIFIHWLLEN
ncbi:hypothetical protein JYT44_02740 [Caldithrix abyssi]|nr:hypothetical protein [Caldithrix abyssi]